MCHAIAQFPTYFLRPLDCVIAIEFSTIISKKMNIFAFFKGS